MGRRNSSRVLIAIALFKLVKAALLVALGVSAFSLRHDSDIYTTLRHVVGELRLDPHNRIIDRVIGRISGLDARRLAELGIGTLVYAAVFLVEGIGLLRRKSWAEYLTIVVTSSFIPFEIYEMARKPSALKAIALALNALIVFYLIARRFRERSTAVPGAQSNES